MKENFKNMPIMGKKLNKEESREIIKDLREKYPDIDKLIELAVERFNKQKTIKTSFI